MFALANAGLRLAGSGIGSSAALTVLVAVVVARVVGKLAGITGATTAVTRLAGPGYDPRLPARQHVVVGALGSVGFTVPLLIIEAALPPGSLTVAATAGLLLGTVIGIAVASLVARSARQARALALANRTSGRIRAVPTEHSPRGPPWDGSVSRLA